MTTDVPGVSVGMQEGGRRRRRPGEAEGPRQEGLIAENPLLRGAGQGSRRVRLAKPSWRTGSGNLQLLTPVLICYDELGVCFA